MAKKFDQISAYLSSLSLIVTAIGKKETWLNSENEIVTCWMDITLLIIIEKSVGEEAWEYLYMKSCVIDCGMTWIPRVLHVKLYLLKLIYLE